MKIGHNLVLLFLFLKISAGYTQTYTPSPQNKEARQKFQDMKYGLFVHWGASSVLGHGEWVMNN